MAYFLLISISMSFIVPVIGASFTIGAIISLIFIPKQNPRMRAAILALWLIVPPVYFFGEFHYDRDWSKLPAAEMTDVKDSEDSASKVWAGVAAALALLYFKKD